MLQSNGLFEYFDTLQTELVRSGDVSRSIECAIHKLSDVMKPGKVEVWIEGNEKLLASDGLAEHYNVFEGSLGFNPDVFCEKQLTTGDDGYIRFKLWPRAGVTWNEDQLKTVEFTVENSFMIIERTRLLKVVDELVITDQLTGVLNIFGVRKLGDVLAQNNMLEKYTAVYLNIKNFDYINKSAGQKVGDLFLVSYTKKIISLLLSEEIISRTSEDNFFLLIKDERVDDFLDKIKEVRLSVIYEGKSYWYDIYVRAGIHKIKPGETVNDVMNYTAYALNNAKHSGNSEDFVRFDMSMMEEAINGKEVLFYFPSALKNKELLVYYQPKVSLDDSSLCGGEALVRWYKDGKIIQPMEFIPILERDGTICKLDFYVLEQVCIDIRDWLDRGIEPVKISVNFSKVHLHNAELAENIINVIRKYNIDSKYLEIELTEMSGSNDTQAMSEFLDKIEGYGIDTSIDDFGTGYSSLNMLRDTYVDVIKLDKSFLDRLNEKKKSDEIVIKNIVSMVRELDMKVIAEGVETKDQVDFLKSINCCMAQGYLYDKPLPHDEFEARLIKNRVYNV